MSQTLMLALAVIAGGAVLALLCLVVLWLVIRSALPKHRRGNEAESGMHSVPLATRLTADQAREFGEEIKVLNTAGTVRRVADGET